MKSMTVGWMVFSEYCRLREIQQNGHHVRKLSQLDEKFKEDLTPESSRTTWAVNVNEADKIFLGGNGNVNSGIQVQEEKQ